MTYIVKKTKKIKDIGKFKLETAKNIWIDEFVCPGKKMYSFKCGVDSKKKLRSISIPNSKFIKFEEKRKCLDKEEYQRECNNYILKSTDHEMCLQEKKSTLSPFDDKRCYKKMKINFGSERTFKRCKIVKLESN